MQNNGKLKVYFFDIGQGDSIFIETPSRKQILIDGGPSDKVIKELGGIMPFFDRSIDMVVATHPDADHITGLIYVLKKYNVDYILTSGVNGDTDFAESLLGSIAKEKSNGAQEIIARRGQEYDFGDGVRLLVLFPDRELSNVDTNDASIVCKLIYKDTSVLLTGDSPKGVEKYLIALDRNILKSDILKLGHHGSKTSSDVSFLGFVAPRFAIVSAGKNNKYHHPHKSVIDLVTGMDIDIKSTAISGTIYFESNGKE